MFLLNGEKTHGNVGLWREKITWTYTEMCYTFGSRNWIAKSWVWIGKFDAVTEDSLYKKREKSGDWILPGCKRSKMVLFSPGTDLSDVYLKKKKNPNNKEKKKNRKRRKNTKMSMIVAILTSWRFLIKPIVLSSPTDNKTWDNKNGLPMPQTLTAYNIPPHTPKNVHSCSHACAKTYLVLHLRTSLKLILGKTISWYEFLDMRGAVYLTRRT